MRAAVWHGRRDVRVDTVPDPTIEEPTDAIVRDHFERPVRLGSAPVRGDGAVHDRGRHPRPRTDGCRRGGGQPRSPTSRPVIGWSSRSTSPAVTAGCATSACSRSARRPRSTSTTRVRRCSGTPSSTGRSREGRPSYCGCRKRSTARSRSRRVRQTTGSCTCPTCCRRRGRRCSTPPSLTAAAWSSSDSDRSGRWRVGWRRTSAPSRVIGVDLVSERLERAARHGAEVVDLRSFGDQDDAAVAIRDLLHSSGPDSVIDAVGMEAHGSGGAKFAQQLTALLPGQGDGEADDPRRHRPPRRAADGDRRRAARWHHLARRRVRRHDATRCR